MRTFVIYCHTNLVNGKQYVGQTKQNVAKRWRGHVWASKKRTDGVGCSALNAAIRKYGADAFTHEILDIVSTQDGANRAEVVWIEQRRTRAPYGYNLDGGGNAHAPKHATTRKKLSDNARARHAALPPNATCSCRS